MFSDHVHTDILEDLEVVYHGFVVWRCIESVGPVSLTDRSARQNEGQKDLLEGTECEEHFTIE
jgi:hypothetical protein